MISLILGAVTLSSAAFGAIAGAAGIAHKNQAKEMAEHAQKRYEYAVSDLKADWEGTNKLAQEYGQCQIHVMMRTIGRFVNFIERNSAQVKQSENKFLEELEGISVEQLQEYKAAIREAKQFFIGIAETIGTTAGYSGAMSLATLLGAASIEVAISELSGAAAWNAILASLGTGTAVSFGELTIDLAILIDGFEGENPWIKLQEYEAKVNLAIAKMAAVKDCMQQVRRRITELKSLLESLNNRAVLGLNELEFLPSFDYKNVSKFQQVALLVQALAEVMKTSILETEGFAPQKVNSAESWQYIVSVYTDYVKLAQEENTKQGEIPAWEKETIAKINRERKLLITYLELWFDDHAKTFSGLIAVVDMAIALGTVQNPIAQTAIPSGIASGNNEQLASALNSIIEIAKGSPFQELANLTSVSATLVKPNHKWTF